MIYLDYASTTPIRSEVLQAYEKILHQTKKKVPSSYDDPEKKRESIWKAPIWLPDI